MSRIMAPGMSLLREFKAFALKGNVIDLAVAVIIGTAFGKVIDSLVKHILMPAISMVLPAKQSYLEWKIGYADKVIPYGLFIGEVVNFVIVAFAVFIFIVKFLGWVMRLRSQEAAGEPAAPPTRTEELLTEIRDLLRRQA